MNFYFEFLCKKTAYLYTTQTLRALVVGAQASPLYNYTWLCIIIQCIKIECPAFSCRAFGRSCKFEVGLALLNGLDYLPFLNQCAHEC